MVPVPRCALAASGDALGCVFSGPAPRSSLHLPSRSKLFGDVGVFRGDGKTNALLLDYYPCNSPHAAMVQPASETERLECLIRVAAGVRMCLSLTTINHSLRPVLKSSYKHPST